MNRYALLAALPLLGLVASAAAAPRQLLLDVDFPARDVAQVEVGDFHFRPGQKAPVHTHAAPAIGYVSKGTILYQVEGQPMQVLKAGDAFYEPAGPRILHFDNASASAEAVFTDFNLERAGDPFIVFEQQPSEKIDRRTFPTAALALPGVRGARAAALRLDRAETLHGPLLGYVAAGQVTLAGRRYRQGETFSLAAGQSAAARPIGTARAIAFTPVR
jgi:quercetin dioxygenase-like cupin family protein